MTTKLTMIAALVSLFAAAGCSGLSKSLSNNLASGFGADWIVVQFAQDGTPFNCWKLRGASVDSGSGGNVDWKDTANGHLVHITGWENRVQVEHGDYESATRLIGVDASRCANGIYPSK